MLKRFKTVILCGILLFLITVSGVAVHAQPQPSKDDYYTVSFHSGSGSVNTAYKRLRMRVKANRVVRLPEIPTRKGYKNIGWAQKTNACAADKKVNDKIRVSKDLDYYAVQKKTTAIVFHRNDGSVFRTDYIASYRRLPTMKNEAGSGGYTFMGWSTKPYQKTNPEYLPGDIVRPTSTMHLYAVEFDRTEEVDVSPWRLPQIDTKKYSKVIFVGDSRTQRMGYTLENECEMEQLEDTAFVARGGQGLSWFKTDGEKWLYQEVKSAKATAKKPVAVVFNLGVNDLYRRNGRPVDTNAVIRNYVSYMNRLGESLNKKNCKLFYMSVNPYNSVMLPNPESRVEEDARTLNAGLKSGLSSRFTYLDAYNELLMRTGYSTDSGRLGYNTECDDGLHYSTQTYKRIYRYCINKVNRAR